MFLNNVVVFCPLFIKSCPGYTTSNMAAYNDERMAGFPQDCLPIQNELLRNSTVVIENDPSLPSALSLSLSLLFMRLQFTFYRVSFFSLCTSFSVAISFLFFCQNDFTSSFIAGMYQDSRMGVAELREKRMVRLRKQQATVAQAQAQVAAKVVAMEAKKQEAKARKKLQAALAAARRREAGIMRACAKIIQRAARARLARQKSFARLRKCAAKLAADQANRIKQRKRVAAARVVQKHGLRYIAHQLGKHITGKHI